MNDPAIPISAAYAAFFLAHANEKQAQANGVPIDRCASACSFGSDSLLMRFEGRLSW
jgi:hypothetical protein